MAITRFTANLYLLPHRQIVGSDFPSQEIRPRKTYLCELCVSAVRNKMKSILAGKDGARIRAGHHLCIAGQITAFDFGFELGQGGNPPANFVFG